MQPLQTPIADYHGNRRRNAQQLQDWHGACSPEPAIEPGLPLVDPHHHLYGSPTDVNHYTRQDLLRDIGSGHRVMGTVYLEGYDSGWYTDGPPELQSTGEVEMIVRETTEPLILPQGRCEVAAGIVSSVDLTLGDGARAVINAHLAVARGRLRGARHHLTHDTGLAGRYVYNKPPHLAADPDFLRGYACLEAANLSFDAFIFHTQLEDLAELARAFPRTPIVLDHVGTMIRVAEFAARREAVLEQWRRSMRVLAQYPNIFIKIGGLGMPIFGFGFEHAARPATSVSLATAWQPIVDECIDLFGASRCMLESNFPVDKQSCGYAELWNAFKRITQKRSAHDRKALFYRTACQVYRLPELERTCDQAWQEQS